jgi:signal transduction histidine kinase/ActR/RegA family two-component response regulator
MFGRSLTSRLVLTIAGMTFLSAAIVATANAWMTYRILHMPDSGSVATVQMVAASAFLFALVAVCVATLIGWRVGQAMTRPVLRMAGTMRRMADGDLDAQPPATHPGTEMRHMAQALEAFRLNARERLEAEAGRRAAEQVAQERSDFLAVMSHEIRTPMNGVLGMAEALQRSNLTAAQQEMLAILMSSGDSLMHLLNDVLDFSKIESGRFELDHEVLELGALVLSVVDLFQQEAEKKGLCVDTGIPAEPIYVRGDAARIRQVVANLVSNAVKFTRKGEVRVQLSCEVKPDGVMASISVRDTGIGIAAEVQPKLFKKFVQVDGSSTRIYGGTGLGLAISRELATLMGGEIDLQSRPGLGSTFTLNLRLERAAAPAVEAGPSAPEQPLRVLAAEDDVANRQVLQIILEAMGAQVTFAHDGAAAVELFAAQAFDLVLMDIHMPTLDGLEAARTIRLLETQADRRVPILAVSANGSPADLAACRDAGMDDHVGKPISPARLSAAITTALAARETARSTLAA